MMNEVEMKNRIESIKAKYNGKYNIYSTHAFYRDYDDTYEILGQIDDPTVSMNDFVGREVLFPKKWVTLEVLNSEGGKV